MKKGRDGIVNTKVITPINRKIKPQRVKGLPEISGYEFKDQPARFRHGASGLGEGWNLLEKYNEGKRRE